MLQGGNLPAWKKKGGGADGYIRDIKPVVFGRYIPDSIAYLHR